MCVYVCTYSGKRQDFGGVLVHFIGCGEGRWDPFGSPATVPNPLQRSPCRPCRHILAVLDLILDPKLSLLVAMLSKSDAKMAQHSPR